MTERLWDRDSNLFWEDGCSPSENTCTHREIVRYQEGIFHYAQAHLHLTYFELFQSIEGRDTQIRPSEDYTLSVADASSRKTPCTSMLAYKPNLLTVIPFAKIKGSWLIQILIVTKARSKKISREREYRFVDTGLLDALACDHEPSACARTAPGHVEGPHVLLTGDRLAEGNVNTSREDRLDHVGMPRPRCCVSSRCSKVAPPSSPLSYAPTYQPVVVPIGLFSGEHSSETCWPRACSS